MANELTIDGAQVSFTRRRYSRTAVFTWLHVNFGDGWIEDGSPWPGINWPRAEIVRVIRQMREDGAKPA